jgi:ferric-dicitrate binding protein FerR (iron transport regulator)
MKRYEDFTIADFIRDDFFLSWIKQPTPEAEQFWEQWMILHPDRKSLVLEARRLVLSVDFRKTRPEDIPAEVILNRIRNSIREEAADLEPKTTRPTIAWRRIAVAATILIAVAAGVTAYLTQASRLITVDTGYNERKRLILPDESIVMLNAHSTLRYSSEWSTEENREVWLQGEAFFEVTRSATQQKFLVHTENVDVEVLGTTFNVLNRRGKTQVVLNSGRVRLTSDDTREKAITIEPGELAELSRGQDVFITRQVNPILYTSWTSNQLSFQQSTLKEIMQTLEDNYGYRVENRVSEIEDQTFTGTIPTVDLDTVLYVLSEAYGADFKKIDGAIVISAQERR